MSTNIPMAVFITRQGYIKRISLDVFERQNRATRGKGGIKTKEKAIELIKAGASRLGTSSGVQLL